jgi:hypothetical protein
MDGFIRVADIDSRPMARSPSDDDPNTEITSISDARFLFIAVAGTDIPEIASTDVASDLDTVTDGDDISEITSRSDDSTRS